VIFEYEFVNFSVSYFPGGGHGAMAAGYAAVMTTCFCYVLPPCRQTVTVSWSDRRSVRPACGRDCDSAAALVGTHAHAYSPVSQPLNEVSLKSDNDWIITLPGLDVWERFTPA